VDLGHFVSKGGGRGGYSGGGGGLVVGQGLFGGQ
jgi:hypothetical protein